MFWKPTIAIEGDAASAVLNIHAGLTGYKCETDWVEYLRQLDTDKETTIL
jgi:acetolactate synthase-like protein